jgi:excisionase family DNA binding protein
MASATLERGPIAATESERPALARIEDLFESHVDRGPRLITAEGEVIELPESLFRVVRQVINALTHDQAVAIVPVHKQLTTQQAADLLGVSRPFLVELLDQGELPYTKTGSHRRVRFDDLMAYRKRRDLKRREGLARLTQMSQEFGLYSNS